MYFMYAYMYIVPAFRVGWGKKKS